MNHNISRDVKKAYKWAKVRAKTKRKNKALATKLARNRYKLALKLPENMEEWDFHIDGRKYTQDSWDII